VRTPLAWWLALEHCAALAYATGRYTKAVRRAAEAYEVITDTGHPMAFGSAGSILCPIALDIGFGAGVCSPARPGQVEQVRIAIPAEEGSSVTSIPGITLNNGQTIPQFGFGVFLIVMHSHRDRRAAVGWAR
jgi:hypothetical protein